MTTSTKSTADLLAEIVVLIAVGFAIDAFAAWALMTGLHGLHLHAGFWPCFMVVVAISVAAKGGNAK